MTSLLSRISRWLGFGKSRYDIRVDYLKPYLKSSGEVVFDHLSPGQINMIGNGKIGDTLVVRSPAWMARNLRLAQIARQRDALKTQLAKAIRDKKARAPIYAALRALSVEELNLESGR